MKSSSPSFPNFIWERLLPFAKFHFALILLLGCLPASAQTNSAPAVPSAPSASATPAPAPKPAAQTSGDPFSDPLIKQVQSRHEKAVKGDTKETKALTTDLEKWTKEQPNNHLLQAYLGSTYTLDSRDAWPGPGKLTYLRDGGKLLDAAVTADPNNPAVRFVRAINYYSLPALFGKRQTARDDFKLLLQQVDGTVKSPYHLNVETRQAIYYYAGLAFQQNDDTAKARTAWQTGLKLAPTTPLATKINQSLADLD